MACTIDFRRLVEGLGGQKNKRKRSESEPQPESTNQSMDLDHAIPSSKRQAIPSASDASKPSYSRPTCDGTIAGNVSGRTWKHVCNQRASATRASRRGSSLELRTKEKELKRAFKERVSELKD